MNETPLELIQARIDSIKKELDERENHPVCLTNGYHLSYMKLGQERLKSELNFLEKLLECLEECVTLPIDKDVEIELLRKENDSLKTLNHNLKKLISSSKFGDNIYKLDNGFNLITSDLNQEKIKSIIEHLNKGFDFSSIFSEEEEKSKLKEASAAIKEASDNLLSRTLWMRICGLFKRKIDKEIPLNTYKLDNGFIFDTSEQDLKKTDVIIEEINFYGKKSTDNNK
jgi:hypothetical protein